MSNGDRPSQTNVYLLVDGEAPAWMAGSLKHLGPLTGPVPMPVAEPEPRLPSTYGPVSQAAAQNPSGFFLDRYVF